MPAAYYIRLRLLSSGLCSVSGSASSRDLFPPFWRKHPGAARRGWENQPPRYRPVLDGASPLCAALKVVKWCRISAVFHRDKPVWGFISFSVLICATIYFCAAVLSAITTSLVPRATTAFNFLEPITAPRPDVRRRCRGWS